VVFEAFPDLSLKALPCVNPPPGWSCARKASFMWTSWRFGSGQHLDAVCPAERSASHSGPPTRHPSVGGEATADVKVQARTSSFELQEVSRNYYPPRGADYRLTFEIKQRPCAVVTASKADERTRARPSLPEHGVARQPSPRRMATPCAACTIRAGGDRGDRRLHPSSRSRTRDDAGRASRTSGPARGRTYRTAWTAERVLDNHHCRAGALARSPASRPSSPAPRIIAELPAEKPHQRRHERSSATSPSAIGCPSPSWMPPQACVDDTAATTATLGRLDRQGPPPSLAGRTRHTIGAPSTMSPGLSI